MDYISLKKRITKYNEKNLSEKRLKHTEGVVETAIKLAEINGEDTQKAELAALFHDMFKCVKTDALNVYVRELKLDKKYLDNSNLAHGKVAALIMKKDYDITDEDIINAVSFHTTGRSGMSMLERIIYIADAVEPNRKYPGVEEIRNMAFKDINKACLMSMERTVSYVNENGDYLDQDTLEARDYMVDIIEEKEEKTMENKDFAMLAAKTLSDKKALDIVIIDIQEKASFADYFVIASGSSDRQVDALVDYVEDAFAVEGLLAKSIEGKDSGWMLMDFGDIIVNIFTQEMRDKYNIEKVWADCPSEIVE